MTKKRRRQLTCRDYMRMPLCQAVLGHIKTCPSRHALANDLGDDVDRRAYAHEHRNWKFMPEFSDVPNRFLESSSSSRFEGRDARRKTFCHQEKEKEISTGVVIQDGKYIAVIAACNAVRGAHRACERARRSTGKVSDSRGSDGRAWRFGILKRFRIGGSHRRLEL
jgi:hypothetical protein